MASRLYPASCILYRLLFLLFLVLPDKDMPFFLACLVDLEDLLPLVLHAFGYIVDRRLVIENKLEHLAEAHLLDRELGTDKRIRTNLTLEVNCFISFDIVSHSHSHCGIRISDCGIKAVNSLLSKIRNLQSAIIPASPLPP